MSKTKDFTKEWTEIRNGITVHQENRKPYKVITLTSNTLSQEFSFTEVFIRPLGHHSITIEIDE